MNVLNQITEIFLKDPEEGEELARKYGLWGILKDKVLHPMHMRFCRMDVNKFIEYVFIDPETGEYLEQQDFHIVWQGLFTNFKRVLIAAPRGHGKTIQVIGRIIWELGKNHDLRIKIIGSGDEKAKEILGMVRELISRSERVQEVFPDLLIDTERGDTKTAFFLVRNIPQRDPSVEASGVLSAGAGGRADLLVCDDIVDLKNAVLNPALRDQVIKAVKETWFSLVASTGRTIWICTPYHVADATHNLKNESSDTWKVWWTPAITYEPQFDENEEPVLDEDTEQQIMVRTYLWPDKWDQLTLDAKSKEVGVRAFARQYLLNAMSDEERTFPESSLQQSFDRGLRDVGDGIEDNWPTFGGVDLGASLGRKNAWTVICTLAISPYDHRIHIKEIYRRRIPFSSTIEAIVRQNRKHNWQLVMVENNAYQTAVINALEEQTQEMVPVRGFTTGSNKANDLVGLPGMNVGFEKGHFAIPAARFPLQPDEGSEVAIMMNELRTHPGGEFSDVIMAMWFAWSAIKRGGGGDFEDAYTEAIAG